LKKRTKKLLIIVIELITTLSPTGLQQIKVFWFFFSKKNCFFLPAVLYYPFRRRRKLPQQRRRSNRPRHQITTAIRTNPTKHIFRARRAKGALECADAGVRRIWRQIKVAALAVRSQLQH
jgi:hypothetical protein